MMVFRTFEKVSYALVMESTRPIQLGRRPAPSLTWPRPVDTDVLEAWLRLRHAPGAGSATLARPSARVCDPRGRFSAAAARLRAVGLGDAALAVLQAERDAPG
jgi:hypothetical protein